MDYKIITMEKFKVIGFSEVFDGETAYDEIPKFWDRIYEKYFNRQCSTSEPAGPIEKAITDNNIGEYGICIDDAGDGRFSYLIAGKYNGGEVPKEMRVYEFEAADWAVFDCCGPLPKALQDVNTKIFKEWLPGNPDYEFSGNANIEWYDMSAPGNDHSAIWIPVKKKL